MAVGYVHSRIVDLERVPDDNVQESRITYRKEKTGRIKMGKIKMGRMLECRIFMRK